MIGSPWRGRDGAGVAAVLLSVMLAACTGAGSASPTPGQPARPGEVLFGTGAGSDACHVEGQTPVFGPSDQIYLAGIMREPVPSGDQVVGEIKGDGGTLPFFVTLGPASEWRAFPAQAPYACFGTTVSIGPAGSGTVVVRFVDIGQPGSPDLATGTFMVGSGPTGGITPNGSPGPTAP